MHFHSKLAIIILGLLCIGWTGFRLIDAMSASVGARNHAVKSAIDRKGGHTHAF